MTLEERLTYFLKHSAAICEHGLTFEGCASYSNHDFCVRCALAFTAQEVAEEREACAKVADAETLDAVRAGQPRGEWWRCADKIAAAIRART